MRSELELFILCLSCVNHVCGLFVFTPVVEVTQGKLRGVRNFSGQYRYYGIPYAVSQRFQPPQPPKKWSGIFQAVSQFDSCAQTFAIFQLGTENCHRLDVYAPEQAERRHKLPVLVYFHGGAYYYGSKWHYDPDFLIKKNVIVVIVNYRLSLLGFLCLNDVANLGLKDQLAALKWVQENIAAFGGDPDNVTISGHSAGSTSAGMHILSKRSTGLFHKAILMSGVPLAPWAFNPEPLTAAFKDAAKITPVRNELDVYNTFLNLPLNDILSVTRGTSIDPKYFKYSPCVDTNFTEPFFHDTPYNIITSGNFNKVPMLLGSTDREGIIFFGLNNQKSLEYLDNNFVDRLPSVFSWCSEKDKKQIAKQIRSHYFGQQRINSKSSIEGVVDFYSDWIAYSAFNAFSTLMAKYSNKPVYNYIFSYEGDRNFAKTFFGHGIKGASHTDDIFYIFKPGGITIKLSDADKLTVDRITTMLTNFMKFGDPTPQTSRLVPIHWPPTTANSSLVMRIDQQLSVMTIPATHRGSLLRELLCRHGLKGYVPCDSAEQCNLQLS